MSGVAKKKDQNVDKRGELIEQNQDGLEYSSEEEVIAIFDLPMLLFYYEIDSTYSNILCSQ